MTIAAEEGEMLLRVAGKVPAVEFHPFVVRAAHRLGVRGWVQHDPAGALIRAIGTEDQLVLLVRAIRTGAPAAVSIRALDPEVITANTPAVSDHFTALAEASDWHEPAIEVEGVLTHLV